MVDSTKKMLHFANSVAKLCIDKYESLKKTGKPGNQEWTVLAGIILKRDNGTLSLVSLATGTKCLSGVELTDTKLYEIGDRLSDSHAEILARRGFLLYLYDQIDLLSSSKNSEIFINTNERIELKPGVSFHFYCSQTPCGDCSIIPMNQNDTYDNNLNRKKPKLIPDYDTIPEYSMFIGRNSTPIQDIHRTGAKCLAGETKQDLHLSGLDYHVTGPLRTKPGRGELTLSLSCSDKIAKWNILGMQGSLLSLFVPPVRLETIVIGNKCPFSHEAMERGIYKRFGNDLNGPNILQAEIAFLHKKDSLRTRPCPSSIVWCDIRNRNTEITVDGRKQGATKNKKINDLLISRKALLRRFLRTVDNNSIMNHIPSHPKKIYYYHCKQWCSSYQQEWMNLRATRFRNWPEKPAILQKFSL